jgi:hypothetical protein
MPAHAPAHHYASEPEPPDPPAPAQPDDELVRPFLVTGGRTHPLRDGLRIETIVTAPPSALSAPLRFEARRIVEVCQQPMAVVDVAVALRVPLGVAKVLIGDLVTEGYLRCGSQEDELSIELIERIRDRVRAL